MKLYFRSRKLQKVCESLSEAQRAYGKVVASKLAHRLAELRAVETLADLRQMPHTGFHQLKGDRSGQYALGLPNGWRLLISPRTQYVGKSLVDLATVREIQIDEVTNYHD
jgi:toxin HigB-1